MITPDQNLLETILAEARLAPSVHNIQPTRWALAGERILLLNDPQRRLPAADASGHDALISHGAALEGFSLALGKRGLRLVDLGSTSPYAPEKPFQNVASFALTTGGEHDQLAASVERRTSWRGVFAKNYPDADDKLRQLATHCSNLLLVTASADIKRIADLGDEAAYRFLCDDAHRAELLHWMRLSPTDPNFHRDGLNAPQMSLGRLEAIGAGLALGPLFPALKTIGLARPLTSEAAKTRSSAAIALFHRPTTNLFWKRAAPFIGHGYR